MVNPQTNEAMDVKVQNQNNVICFSNIRGMIHFEFVPKWTTIKQTFYAVVLKRFIDTMGHK
jgi:hypothetical protein